MPDQIGIQVLKENKKKTIKKLIGILHRHSYCSERRCEVTAGTIGREIPAQYWIDRATVTGHAKVSTPTTETRTDAAAIAASDFFFLLCRACQWGRGTQAPSQNGTPHRFPVVVGRSWTTRRLMPLRAHLRAHASPSHGGETTATQSPPGSWNAVAGWMQGPAPVRGQARKLVAPAS